MIPPPTGTLWLCGTSVYSILLSQFNGRCTLVYVLPAIREYTHSTSSSPHLQNSASTNKDGCIPGLTCVQTWWSRTLGALIPSYGVMQALDQVRSLSDSVQKLANDTVLALGNIKDTLASHKMMILQNRVALDYILATQGGACTIIGPECCTGLMDPTENLNKIQQDILGLSAKLHQMTEDNSSWFGNLLGKPWLWIKKIAILLLFLLLAYYLCIHSIKCFFQQTTNYGAAGQAASALHAMALLQVHQAKALKQLHEGDADPGVLQELRTATDLALRATKVTARALGQTMSTLVVQERHLWLTLADMREADKHRFLDSPISQAGLFSEAVEDFAQQFSAAQKQTEAFRHILPRRSAAVSTPPPAAAPPSARRRGRPPAASTSAPARPQQQPALRPQRGAGRRRPAQPASAPAKPVKRQGRRRP